MENENLILKDSVLIGVGNRWRRDDGLGPAFIERAQITQNWRGSTLIIPGEMFALLDSLVGRKVVIFVDAYLGTDANSPIVFESWQKIKSHQIWNSFLSSHGMGLAEALNMAETLGQLPEKVFILAIPGYDFEYGEGLSQRASEFLEDALFNFERYLRDVCMKSTY